MKLNSKKSYLLLLLSALVMFFLFSCKNPFLEDAIEMYEVKFVTDCEISIKSYKTSEIESIQELTKEKYEFDGWYTSEDFNGGPITFPYKVTHDITLYAKWIDKKNIAYITPSNYTKNNNNHTYSNEVLSITSEAARAVFSGIFNDLSIKLNNANTKLVFDNFTLSSSKSSPLIESSSGLFIEYTGSNKLLSSSSGVNSLIISSGTIEIRGGGKSSLELLPNTTTTTDCTIVKASKVIINGGILKINGSNGWNNSTDGTDGGNGSSGIKASETVIKNNAVVTIEAGNGANGNKGRIGDPGNDGIQKGMFGEDSTNGESGKKGQPGGKGGKGGTAIVGNLTVESCKTVTLTGGNGGKGGQGGKGGTGGKGGWCSLWGKKSCDGGDGGQGGTGGNGGDGGDAVSGSLAEGDGSIYTTAGIHGEAGERGERGEPGAGGEHRGQGGGAGNSGKYGDYGESGEPGKDGVEHR